MKNWLLFVALFILVLNLLVGCSSQSINEATDVLEPTNTKEPTITPTEITYDAEKAEIANNIQLLTNVDGTNIFCKTATWEGDLLKIKCDLVDWFSEPTQDHHFLHYWVLDEAICLSLQDDDWEKYFTDSTIIEIVTVGKVMQQLSETGFSTFEKIMDSSITTEVEWIREADITIN